MKYLKRFPLYCIMYLAFLGIYGQSIQVSGNSVLKDGSEFLTMKPKDGYPVQTEIYAGKNLVMILDSQGAKTEKIYWYVYFPRIAKAAIYLKPLTKNELMKKLVQANILNESNQIDKKAVGSYMKSNLGSSSEVSVMDVPYVEPSEIQKNLALKSNLNKVDNQLKEAEKEGRLQKGASFKESTRSYSSSSSSSAGSGSVSFTLRNSCSNSLEYWICSGSGDPSFNIKVKSSASGNSSVSLSASSGDRICIDDGRSCTSITGGTVEISGSCDSFR